MLIQLREKSVILIIVNYNHKQEIRDLLNRTRNVISKVDIKIDPIVIDDCSTDGSPKIAESMGYKVLYHSVNRGVGAVIRTGIEYGIKNGYQSVLILSANGKMQPEEIPSVLEPILNGTAHYVQGSRFLLDGKSLGLSLFRTIMIPIFSIVTSLILKRRFSDITCGYRAYKLDWISSPEINLDQSWLDRYELEFYIHYWACKKKLRIKEVPVTIMYSHLEKNRKSYIRPFIGWWSMIRPFIYLSLKIKK